MRHFQVVATLNGVPYHLNWTETLPSAMMQLEGIESLIQSFSLDSYRLEIRDSDNNPVENRTFEARPLRWSVPS